MDFPGRYEPQEMEPKIRDFWKKREIYRFDPESSKPCFSIDTPPPTVSAAQLHVGHAMSYTQAEIIVRYKRMRGFNVFYPMGFDDNGLPTERYVEKKYGISRKNRDRDAFIELCLKETRQGTRAYRNLWEILGLSVDWQLEYSTISPLSRRTAQKSFLDLKEKGLISRRNEPNQCCFRCGTALAQADVEVRQEKAKCHDIIFSGPEGQILVISTTRPEMLAACVALYTHPDDTRFSKWIGKQATVPLFGHSVPIRTHRDVDPEYGSGLMMVCTWGDAEDVVKWREDRLDTRLMFDAQGRLNRLAAPFESLTAGEARSRILTALAGKGLLTATRSIRHPVGVHERCGQPVEFTQSPQWFIRILDHRDTFLRLGRELTWWPDYMQVRYEDWVKGLKWDWSISRQRFYGVPFPVWFCDRCGKPLLAPEQLLPVDPSRVPPPDGSVCDCGYSTFTGDSDVMDTWMTSSLTPLINAQWAGEPGASRYAEIYPMSLRVQAFEIIRTWLFYTIVKSHYHTGSLPWHSVMISGWGLDANGKKMSKSKGNFADPLTIIEKFSADALRYWAAGATLGNNLRYQERDVKAGRRLLNKLWNASRLISQILYDESGKPHPLSSGEPTLMDRWIRSRFAGTLQSVTDAMERYDYAHALENTETFFFQHFCDNYLELVKPRFRENSRFTDGQTAAARDTLSRILSAILKLFAPVVPYITEAIYQILFTDTAGAESIHISAWPEQQTFESDPEAETEGVLFLNILTGIRRWKSAYQLHANAPLASLTVTAEDNKRSRLELLTEDLRAAVRAERLTFGPGGTFETDEPGVFLTIET